MNYLNLVILSTFIIKLKPDFFDCDYTFVSNKFFTDNYKFKLLDKSNFLKKFISNKIEFKKIAENLSKKKNLIWFDLTDSAGTTQFEVLPFVKRYVKGQLYKDKDLYRKTYSEIVIFRITTKKNLKLKKI